MSELDFRQHEDDDFGRLLSMIAIQEKNVATNLIVRNVGEDIVLALKQMATSRRRSAEAEHREILRAVL